MNDRLPVPHRDGVTAYSERVANHEAMRRAMDDHQTMLTDVLPPAAAHLNYQGDQTGNMGRVMGPMLGTRDMLTVVSESYDAATDTTRLGLCDGIIQLQRTPA